MKLNNKGFALTSIIYMLIVLFLMVMLLILANLAQRKVVLDKIKNEVKENLNQGGILATNSMIVTFDPQGGQVNQTTKQVTYNEPYGELPTPTKEGYTFLGWNGKNYYNYENIYYVSSGVTSDTNGWITVNTSSGNEFLNYYTYNLDVEKGISYDFFLEIKEKMNITGRLYLTSTYDQNEELKGQFPAYVPSASTINSNTIRKHNIQARTEDGNFSNVGLRTFYHNQSKNTNEVLTFRISVLDADDTITVDNFEYEPYYITPSTTVVQQKNHTLKAIWQANS